MSDETPLPSTPNVTSAPVVDPTRARNAKGHKSTCICTLCKRIQARIDAGLPPKATSRAMAHERRVAGNKDKRFGTTPRNKREKRIAKTAMLTGAVVGQAAVGVRPNIAQAATIAGMDPSQAQRQIKRDKRVTEILERVGITDEKVFGVYSEGMDAKETRLIVRDGEVKDAVEVPDWHARHKFARDLLMVQGHLGNDRDSGAGGGGLIIIAPEVARVVPGHPAACVCDECIAAWNEKTKTLSAQAERAMAIDAEIIENPRALPGALEELGDELETDEEDDFSNRDGVHDDIKRVQNRTPLREAPDVARENPKDDWEDDYRSDSK